jgi:O-antigen/teichoic acid export membrane protein
MRLQRYTTNMVKQLQQKLKAAAANPFILQSFKTLGLRVMGVVVLFGFTLFITNNYPAAIVGQYDFIRSFLLVVGTFCLLGTDQSVLYFSGRLNSTNTLHELKHIYKKMAAILLFTSLLALALVWAAGKEVINGFFGDPTSYNLVFQASAILFFNGLSVLNTELIRAMGYSTLSELLRNTVKYIPVIIGSVVLLYIHKETYLAHFYLYGFVFLGTITTAMAFYYLGRLEHTGLSSPVTTREIVKTSYPISISGMAMFLLMSIDVVMLKKYMGNEYVAYYAQGVKVMTLVSIIILTVNITISTKISELYTSGKMDELKKVVSNASRLTFLLATPAALLVCLFPGTILGFFGPDYAQAAPALTIMIAGQWFSSYFGVVPMYLNMTKKQHYFQYILMGAVLLNFLLNRWLIPVYGMTGAAISYVGSTLFWNVVSAAVIYSKDKLKPFWN